jgi:hypothetical protein
MSNNVSLENLMFDVEEVPIEAVIGRNDVANRVPVPHKKALIHAGNRSVLGVVGRAYRVVTNRKAIALAHEVCQQLFPGSRSGEWEPMRVAAPSTLRFALIDLAHPTHALNFMENDVRREDLYTPFLRVTNSFNGSRALRFDIGFLRKHCSNGVVFEEEVATVVATHSQAGLAKLKVQGEARNLEKMWDEFSQFLSNVRGIVMNEPLSRQALSTVLQLPAVREGDQLARVKAVGALEADINTRLRAYRASLGENAYAVFNTLTDVAARPPENPYFRKDRDTLEKRAGRWLKSLASDSGQTGFDLERWVPAWKPNPGSRLPIDGGHTNRRGLVLQGT